jgi:glycosyltransferase involved in cell wall biosynthesis
LWLDGRVLSVSKRSAYLKYAALPQLARRPFELAVNIGQNDITNDRELLRGCGWKVVDPHEVTGSPSSYQRYIANSRAEILCPKPIYRELKTGWFSDRSVCYLASGRPVIAEETGFSERIPTGNGLLAFHNIEEAAAAVTDIDSNYSRHSRAARELAEEFFDYRRCLDAMLAASS